MFVTFAQVLTTVVVWSAEAHGQKGVHIPALSNHVGSLKENVYPVTRQDFSYNAGTNASTAAVPPSFSYRLFILSSLVLTWVFDSPEK